MKFFKNLLLAACLDMPYKKALRRLNCIDRGHIFEGAERLDKLRSEKHPHSDDEYIFTVNVMKCHNCEMIFLDSGVESRRSIA